MSASDGRAPFILDVKDLGRRAGAMMPVNRTEPAPADLLNPMIAIPEGDDITLDLSAESVIEGVLVTGTATGVAHGSCSRCLDPISEPIEVDLLELYRYDDLEKLTEDEEELPTFKNDLIDLEPMLRDAVVLALPLAPVCREDCPGLCPECGAKMADDPDHHHDQTDARWDKLAGMFGQTSRGEDRDADFKG